MLARLFALIFFLFSPPVFASLQLYNYGGIEFRTSGGYTQVSTASPESTRLRGGVVAEVHDVEPKVSGSTSYPYKTKPGANVPAINGTARVSPSKFGRAAANILKGAGAAAVGAAGGGFVAIGSVACYFYCEDIIGLLGDKVAGFVQNPDGSVSAVGFSSEDDPVSDGYEYYVIPNNTGYYYSKQSACDASRSYFESRFDYLTISSISVERSNCLVTYKYKNSNSYTNFTYSIGARSSNCSAGSYIDSTGTKCFDSRPYGEPLTDAEIAANLAHYVSNSGWPGSRAPHLAAALAPNYDILEDGSAEISGPASVPLAESRTTENIALHPGTNIPVAPGHTGPTDPGTKTTITTSTANNTYNGDTMTTNIVNNTTTNITNNITNITTTDTKTEETDKAPEEEKKEDKDKCEEGAKTIDCAELDTPEGEVPRDEIQITFTPDDLGFGSGSCPADRAIGADYVFSYSATCGMLHSYGRYLVWMLASITALMIIFAGRADA